MVCDTVLEAVGHTPMVRLHRMLLPGSATALLVPLCAIVFPATGLLGNPSGSASADTELAALGRARTNGEFCHAAPGDGLTILDEYRGFFFDGPTAGPTTKLYRHYIKEEYINRLRWVIAHELTHLLVREQNDENWAGNHLKNNSEALMGHNFPYNHGLSHVQGAQAEIEKINFRTRASVAPEGGQE